MKFSVLLPTRNRLEYLRYAVETVRRQDYDDWEVIVSDNCSEEDVEGYVRSLADPRIKYYRTDSFVPVTDNWNNALEKSTGDYVIMLGDDDCLMQSFFSTVSRLVEEFDHPDFVYTSAYLYVYPGVHPAIAEGRVQAHGHAAFLHNGSDQPYLLDTGQARELVKGFVNFKLLYDYNMQFFTVSRKFIESLADKGAFFQSPFPDFYASNVMFLKAERILICPYRLVTIGVTPKSYGFYHINKREDEGAEFLNSLPDPRAAQRLERVLLPGTHINTSWLFSLEALRANYGAEFDSSGSYRRYRFLQITYVYEQVYLHKSMTKDDLRKLKSHMRLWEKLVYSTGLWAILTAKRFLSPANRSKLYLLLRRAQRQHPDYVPDFAETNFNNILEVYERVSPFHGGEAPPLIQGRMQEG